MKINASFINAFCHLPVTVSTPLKITQCLLLPEGYLFSRGKTAYYTEDDCPWFGVLTGACAMTGLRIKQKTIA
jgi:hypothetical protein